MSGPIPSSRVASSAPRWWRSGQHLGVGVADDGLTLVVPDEDLEREIERGERRRLHDRCAGCRAPEDHHLRLAEFEPMALGFAAVVDDGEHHHVAGLHELNEPVDGVGHRARGPLRRDAGLAGSGGRACRHHRPRCTTSSKGRRSGLAMGDQWSIGRVAEGDHVGARAVRRRAEDASARLLVADGGVAAADAEVGGGQQHGHRRLPQVVLIDGHVALRLGLGQDEDDRRLAAARWPAPTQTVDSSRSWARSVTTMKSHFWRLEADGERRPASRTGRGAPGSIVRSL